MICRAPKSPDFILSCMSETHETNAYIIKCQAKCPHKWCAIYIKHFLPYYKMEKIHKASSTHKQTHPTHTTYPQIHHHDDQKTEGSPLQQRNRLLLYFNHKLCNLQTAYPSSTSSPPQPVSANCCWNGRMLLTLFYFPFDFSFLPSTPFV